MTNVHESWKNLSLTGKIIGFLICALIIVLIVHYRVFNPKAEFFGRYEL